MARTMTFMPRISARVDAANDDVDQDEIEELSTIGSE